MKNLIVTAFKIFSRNKAFVMSVVFIPTFMFLMMSVLLPYTEKHTIAVINNTSSDVIKDAVENIDGISIIDADEDEIPKLIAKGTIDLAVIINNNPVTGEPAASVISSGDCEIQQAVELAAEHAASGDTSYKVSVNSADRGKNNLMNTAVFMLNKLIQSGSILGALIIADRKKHIRDRVMLSKVSPFTYLSGQGIVYFVCSCFGVGLYCLVAKLFDFDFGMRVPFHYFIMMCLSNLFAASFYILAASLVSSEEKLEGVSMIILITSFFSGMLFPFGYMPKAFKVIGNFCPQRWIMNGVENIQKSGTFSSALPQVFLTIGVSFVFLIIGSLICNKKSSKS